MNTPFAIHPFWLWFSAVGGAILVFGGIITMLYKFSQWIGNRIAAFVRETVLPPIAGLTTSVDELAIRTHENTESIEKFSAEQAKVNAQTAKELAEIRGEMRGRDSATVHIPPVPVRD